jgi:hypothetical protein
MMSCRIYFGIPQDKYDRSANGILKQVQDDIRSNKKKGHQPASLSLKSIKALCFFINLDHMGGHRLQFDLFLQTRTVTNRMIQVRRDNQRHN